MRLFVVVLLDVVGDAVKEAKEGDFGFSCKSWTDKNVSFLYRSVLDPKKLLIRGYFRLQEMRFHFHLSTPCDDYYFTLLSSTFCNQFNIIKYNLL